MDESPELRRIANDRYREFQLVGQGGMGIVFLALDRDLNRRVALKIVRPDTDRGSGSAPPQTPLEATPPAAPDGEASASFAELRARFLQEAWVTGAMEHPGIVPVYEVGETASGVPYYTMRYVKGERTLASAIRDAKLLDDRLALLEPFLKVCDTVRFAHARGVIHRDLKPENVALGEFGEVIVLDWGLAKTRTEEAFGESVWRARVADLREATHLQSQGNALGTPGYMSPEAALGKSEEVDARSDVYSLGAMLYQILTGRLPFEFKGFLEYVEKVLQGTPQPPIALDPSIPEELSDACMRSLAGERSGRLASVDDLAARVRRWQTEGPVQRQVESLRRHAEADVAAARGLEGAPALIRLDRAMADCTRLLLHRPQDRRGGELLAEIKALREKAIRQRVWSGRVRMLRGIGVAMAASVAAIAVILSSVLARRQAEEEARVGREAARADAAASEASSAARREREAREGLSQAYALLSGSQGSSGAHAAARLLAAKALEVAPTPTAWAALAAAEARWTPTLLSCARTEGEGEIALCPRGPLLLHGGSDRLVRVFDARTGALLRSIPGHAAPITAIAISPDGALGCSGDREGRIRLWDPSTGEALREIGATPDAPAAAEAVEAAEPRAPTAVAALAWSAHDGAILAGYGDGRMRRWDASTGELRSIHVNHRAPLRLLAAEAGSDRWLSAGDDSLVAEGFARNVDLHETSRFGVARFLLPTPDGFAAGFADGSVRTFESEAGTEFGACTVAGGPFSSMACTPGLDRIVAVDPRGEIRFWDVRRNALLARLPGFAAPVKRVVLSADGALLAAGDAAQIRVWDLRMERSAAGEVPPLAVLDASDASRTYRALARGAVAGPQAVAELPAPAAALAVAGRDLVAATLDGALRAFDAATGEPRDALAPGPSPACALAASPDGTLVAAGTVAGGVYLWDRPRARRVELEGGLSEPIRAVALTDDRILALSLSGRALSFHARTRERLPAAPPRSAFPAEDPQAWLARPARERLLAFENHFGVALSGFEIVEIPGDLPRPLEEPISR